MQIVSIVLMFPKVAVIIAGGKGSRIKNYLGNKPKPLIKIVSTLVNHTLIVFLKKFLVIH